MNDYHQDSGGIDWQNLHQYSWASGRSAPKKVKPAKKKKGKKAGK